MNINLHTIKVRNIEDLGQLCFYLGTFFLASALPIAGLFYFIALFISTNKTNNSILKEGWSITLFTITGLILFNTIRFNLLNENNKLFDLNNGSSWVALFNWIPFFLLFIYFQYYLKKKDQRKIFSQILISGTIPVLISCIMQSFFNIYGPWSTLGGLIVWFNKAPDTIYRGVSGLFSNENYTGFWLSAIFPFCISLTLTQKSRKYEKLILIGISFLVVYFLIFTSSRNSIFGLLSSTLLFFGIKKLIIFVLTLIFIITILNIMKYTLTLPPSFWFFNKILDFKVIIPQFNSLITNPLQFLRVNIWFNAVKLIIKNPIFGYGAATFPIILTLGDQTIQHAHNMPIQIAFDYGIITAILLTSFTTLLFIKGYKTLNNSESGKSENLVNKAWLASLLVILIHHLTDIPYYDGKISILIWLILAGVKCIVDEDKKNNLGLNKNIY